MWIPGPQIQFAHLLEIIETTRNLAAFYIQETVKTIFDFWRAAADVFCNFLRPKPKKQSASTADSVKVKSSCFRRLCACIQQFRLIGANFWIIYIVFVPNLQMWSPPRYFTNCPQSGGRCCWRQLAVANGSRRWVTLILFSIFFWLLCSAAGWLKKVYYLLLEAI
jgi:hypothetical protein